MTSKHTPGPWEVVEGGSPGVLHVKGPPLPITIVTIALDIDFAGSLEREANARLIAAAPELLEALIEATACGMVPISSAKEGGASTHSRQVKCADMIRAAIAKATGEA